MFLIDIHCNELLFPNLIFLPLWTNNLYLNQSDFVSDISVSEHVQEIFEEAQCINHILKEVWITGYISHKSLLMFMAGSVMSLLIPNVVLFLLHGILKQLSKVMSIFSSDVPQDILAIPNLDKVALQAAVMVVRLAKMMYCKKKFLIIIKQLNNY